jgi:hypothetical protein
MDLSPLNFHGGSHEEFEHVFFVFAGLQVILF